MTGRHVKLGWRETELLTTLQSKLDQARPFLKPHKPRAALDFALELALRATRSRKKRKNGTRP